MGAGLIMMCFGGGKTEFYSVIMILKSTLGKQQPNLAGEVLDERLSTPEVRSSILDMRRPGRGIGI
jgi:hypothetical protein